MIIHKLFVIIMIIWELFEIIFNYLNLQMNYAPNFELRTWNCCKIPVALWWRSVCTNSLLFFSRLHGVPLAAIDVRWLRYPLDDSNSSVQWRHLKQRICGVVTLWLFCLFIDGILSDSSACRLNCVALVTFLFWNLDGKIFSKVKQERTQNRKTYSRRARERDSFPDIAYSLRIGRGTD